MEKLDNLTRRIKPLLGWLQKQKRTNRKRFTWLAVIFLVAICCCCFVAVMGTLDTLGLLPTSTPTATFTMTRTAIITRPKIPTNAKAPTLSLTPTLSKTQASILFPTKTSVPMPDTPAATSGPVCDCSGDLYNCSDFSRQYKAQACYNYCVAQGRGDIHRLDSNGDGQACESLP